MNEADKLADIVLEVQRREGFQFDLMDVAQIVEHTARKIDLNGEDADYMPLLFENELRDFITRERINGTRRKPLCARFADTAPA